MKNNLFDGDSRFLFKLMLIGLAVFLLFLQINHVLHFPIWRDDALFAIVAKSLASGEGYSEVFFDKSYAFHYLVGAGPTIIMPVALSIFLFGSKFLVPSLSSILLIWILLLGIFYLADDFVGREKKWPFCFLTLLLILLFSLGSYGSELSDLLMLWHLLLGEIPAALFLIIGTFLLFARNISVKKILLGGLFLGLAIMSKILSLIAVAAILLFYAFKIWGEKKFKITRKIQLIILAGICTITPFLIFEIIKIAALGWQGYQDFQIKNAEFYKSYSFITGPVQDNGVTISSDFVRKEKFLKGLLGVTYFSFVPVTIGIAYVALRKRNGDNAHCFLAGMALIFGCFLHAYWWVFFSVCMERYFLFAIICYLAGLTLLLASIDYRALPRFQIAIISTFVFLLLASREQEIKYLFASVSNNDAKRLQEQLLVVDTVKNLQQQGVTMLSCGNNFELEYLLPRSRNFKQCEEVLTKPFDLPAMLVTYSIDQPTSPQRTIRVNSDQYYFVGKLIPKEILSKCSREYLRTENYSLNWCSSD